MSIRFAILAFFSFLIAMPSIAEAKAKSTAHLIKSPHQGPVYALPRQSPLKFKAFAQDGAHFVGKILVHGRFRYGEKAMQIDNRNEGPGLYFEPDEASRALLPYWNRNGQVKAFYFSNPETFILAAIPSDQAVKVVSGNIKSVTGELSIWVSDYIADVACDTPVYTARFLKIERNPVVAAREDTLEPISCG